jgi:hypothetical protein
MAEIAPKESTGLLFWEKQKKNEKAPDLKGRFLFQGQLFEIAIWERKSERCPQFFGYKIQPARTQGQNQGQPFQMPAEPPAMPPQRNLTQAPPDIEEPPPEDSFPF